MWLNGMCVIDERLYLFRIQSDILNRTRVENNVDEIHVSRAIEMADLSRHFKWEKNSEMDCRQFMEYRRNIVGLNGMRFWGSS